MKVLFITNIPSPYRVKFFNLLGQRVDLTVVFDEMPEEQKDRAASWFETNYDGFRPVFLSNIKKKGGKWVKTSIRKQLQKPYDCIILGGYSNPTFIYAIEYMNYHKIPFFLEIDGGLIKKDSAIKKRLKKHLISSASGWLSSGRVSDKYLVHYGAKEEKIFHYPFSSLTEEDIKTAEINREMKVLYKRKLGITHNKMVLFVGQFIHRKGVDVLLNAVKYLDKDIAFCIVGGNPTEQYIDIVNEHGLKNIIFEGFKRGEYLERFFLAADAFVMPTREDIWGLVVNEALCYGLPVVSTDKCVAALELVKNNVNGFIVPTDDELALAEGIKNVLCGDVKGMSARAKESIKGYTIEEMVNKHLEFFETIK